MARFEAQIWVSGELPYQAEINASNVFQARKNIARREGVDEKYVNRVFQVQEQKSSSSSSSSSSFSSGESSTGGALLVGGLLLLGLIMTYWYYVIPAAIVIGILWYFGTRE